MINQNCYPDYNNYNNCNSNETTHVPALADMDKLTTYLDKFALMPPEIYYEKNGSGLSKLFADTNHLSLRYNVDLESWMFFDGRRWVVDKHDINVRKCAKKFANAIKNYVPTQGDYNFKELSEIGKLSTRLTMIRDAEDVHVVRNDDFNQDPDLLNCENGTINLVTKSFYEHRPTDMITELANVTYDPKANSTELVGFLHTIFDQDTERIKYVLRAFGLSLTAHTNEHCLFVFWGESSRNGKSTLLNTFLHMMGSYAVNIDVATLAQRRYFNGSMPSSDLARIQGKRFILSTEPPQSFVFDETRTKAITGGDQITARYLHQNDIQFKPVGKIFIGTNHRPLIEDDSIIESRRIRIVPFNHHFSPEEQDINLPEKLKQPFVLSTLLNCCIGGYLEYKRIGLHEPDSVNNSMAAYQTQEGFVNAFFESELMPGNSTDKILVSKLYPKYSEWSFINGVTPIIKEKFMNLLRDKQILKSHATYQGRTLHNVVIGYKFRVNKDGASVVKINEDCKPLSDSDNQVMPDNKVNPVRPDYDNEGLKAFYELPDSSVNIAKEGFAANESLLDNNSPTTDSYQDSYTCFPNYQEYPEQSGYYNDDDGQPC